MVDRAAGESRRPYIMEDRNERGVKMRQNPSTSTVDQKRETGKAKRKRKRSRSRSSSVTSTSSSSSSSSNSSSSSSSSSRSRSRSSSRESQKKSKIKKRKKEKQHKKFLKDRDKSDKYSMITGKRIKMKVKKTRGDKERDRNRAELLQFLNSAM
ncbi:uncharacterized protein [Hemitrygon akajei]|uniref:uncharacterized protein isoform X2 n=1 Tax=Hemitrygon akajei TaxID=2704970 RepID=UPI003BFA1EFC